MLLLIACWDHPNLKIGDDLWSGGRIGGPVLDFFHVHLHPIHSVTEVASVIRCH